MLLSLVLLAVAAQAWALSTQCDQSASLKFSVSSWRNESGHRLVAADVHSHTSDRDSVSLTVELLTEKCGDSSGVILKTLSSTGQPEEQASVRPTVLLTVSPLPGYHHIPGFGYYKRVSTSMNWKDGVEACRKEGTRMLLVETQEELDAVYGWNGCCPWVGVNRENSSGPWINILGQQMNTTDFFGWLPGYPKGEGNCMLLDDAPNYGTKNLEYETDVQQQKRLRAMRERATTLRAAESLDQRERRLHEMRES
ncbi:uncharacterized protein [Anabrus simplex]|uniref:uncharacterized protein n=1 Tax=Anabrus simplex TaxID=316456 RepID=UPI0035A31FFC